MNAQNTYKVKADSKDNAQEKAIALHKEKGRSLENKSLYFVRAY